jgi:hypothetical protein
MRSEKEFEELIKKVEKARSSGTLDLSTEEDLSIAVMNLVSLEEHFFFTGVKTSNDSYFDLLLEVREMRKELLGRMIDKGEGEVWCISKHLLATTMRLMEVGTKLQSNGDKEGAKRMFKHAYKMYSMFFALRLKLINADGLKKVAEKEKPWDLETIVNKLVDCCDEK